MWTSGVGLTDTQLGDRESMKAACLSVLFLSLTNFLASSACVPPDCDRKDAGTCVNACCKLRWEVASPVWALVAKIEKFLQVQGADGRYALHQNQPSVQPWYSNNTFVVQGTHVTAKELYTDVLHFGVGPTPTGAVVYAFSHSQDFIPGSACEYFGHAWRPGTAVSTPPHVLPAIPH